jgi:hypothetical protein
MRGNSRFSSVGLPFVAAVSGGAFRLRNFFLCCRLSFSERLLSYFCQQIA